MWQTPLHRAAAHGHAEVVALLLGHGARLEADSEGQHALDLAMKHHHEETVVYLAEHGEGHLYAKYFHAG